MFLAPSVLDYRLVPGERIERVDRQVCNGERVREREKPGRIGGFRKAIKVMVAPFRFDEFIFRFR